MKVAKVVFNVSKLLFP